ncbi:MAG: methyltransferase [Polyangiaceae bacterium]|nr:methyltransferase [Polyangiaceae bacterium]
MDAYYSPPSIAEAVAGALTVAPANVLDPSCGGGELLRAVADRFRLPRVFGVDADESAVRSVRTRFPEWIVSRGDATSSKSLSRTRVARLLGACDAMVINPPFSMNRQRRVVTVTDDGELSSSQAMQHLIVACCEFEPAHAIAVLPESLLYSELDGAARRWLQNTYELTVLAELDPDAFGGARARTHLIRLERAARPQVPRSAREGTQPGARRALAVRRGSLQMFRAQPGRVPLLHTTDLIPTLTAGAIVASRRVRSVGSGQTAGYFVLVPRVGSFPREFRVSLMHSDSPVQLSDCLFSIEFFSRSDGHRFVREVRREWDSFIGLLRGTGAAYVTLARLRAWIAENTSFEAFSVGPKRRSGESTRPSNSACQRNRPRLDVAAGS